MVHQFVATVRIFSVYQEPGWVEEGGSGRVGKIGGKVQEAWKLVNGLEKEDIIESGLG